MESDRMRRPRWRVWACALLLVSAAATRDAEARELMFAVSEGSSGGTDHARVLAKYKDFSDLLSAAAGVPIRVVFVREFNALEEGMKSRRFDLVMARPSDYPARGLRDHGYRFVSSALPDGQCLLVVPRDSGIRSLADLSGKRLVVPSPNAYMTQLCLSELREKEVLKSLGSVVHAREQATIPQYLEHKLGDVGGIASYSGAARRVQQSGLRVLHGSVRQPYFPLVVSDAVSASQVQAMQAALKGLTDSAEGKRILKSIEVEGFDTGSERRLRALLPWLEG